MKLKVLTVSILLLLFASLLLSVHNESRKQARSISDKEKSNDTHVQSPDGEPGEEPELDPETAPPIGELYLENYADPSTEPYEDVEKTNVLVQALFSEMKTIDTRFLATNEDVASMLLGKNKYKMKFIAPNSKVLNDKGQLIDRWGTAYMFHLEHGREVAVRSAGPDKEMFTEDDLHRKPDGSYLSAEENLQSSFR